MKVNYSKRPDNSTLDESDGNGSYVMVNTWFALPINLNIFPISS